jgi:hypothetical protein
MTKYLLICSMVFFLSCKKETTPIPAPPPPVFEQADWQTVVDTLKGQYFQGLSGANGNELFVNLWRGWNGLGPSEEPRAMISQDNGTSWTFVNANSGLPSGWTYMQRHKNFIFAGTVEKGLFRSADNGNTWQPLNNNGWIWPNIILSNGNQLFVSDLRLDKSFVSDDDGATWRLAYPEYLRVANFSGNNILAIQRGIILESNNLGNTWRKDSSFLTQLNLSFGDTPGGVSIWKKEDVIYAALSEGVYVKRSGTGNPWVKISSALKETIFLCFETDGTIIVQENYSNRIMYSSDNGNTWRKFNTNKISGRIWNMVKSGKFIFAGGEYGLFKRQVEK